MSGHQDYNDPTTAKEQPFDRKVPVVLTICFSILLAAAVFFASASMFSRGETRTAMALGAMSAAPQSAVGTDWIVRHLIRGWDHRGDANV